MKIQKHQIVREGQFRGRGFLSIGRGTVSFTYPLALSSADCAEGAYGENVLALPTAAGRAAEATRRAHQNPAQKVKL